MPSANELLQKNKERAEKSRRTSTRPWHDFVKSSSVDSDASDKSQTIEEQRDAEKLAVEKSTMQANSGSNEQNSLTPDDVLNPTELSSISPLEAPKPDTATIPENKQPESPGIGTRASLAKSAPSSKKISRNYQSNPEPTNTVDSASHTSTDITELIGKLSSQRIVQLATLKKFASGENVLSLSQAKAASILNLTEKAVRKVFSDLVDAGILEITQEYNASTKQSRVYKIL